MLWDKTLFEVANILLFIVSLHRTLPRAFQSGWCCYIRETLSRYGITNFKNSQILIHKGPQSQIVINIKMNNASPVFPPQF